MQSSRSELTEADQLFLLQCCYIGVIREAEQESSGHNVSDRRSQFCQSTGLRVHTNGTATGCHLVQGVEAERY